MFHLIVSKQYVYYIIFLGFVFRRLLSAGTDKQDMGTTCKASFLIGHIHYLIWLYMLAVAITVAFAVVVVVVSVVC